MTDTKEQLRAVYKCNLIMQEEWDDSTERAALDELLDAWCRQPFDGVSADIA